MLLKFLCLSVFFVVYIASSQVNNKITSVLWFDMTEAMLRLIRNSDRVYLDWNNRSNRFSTKIERCYVVFCLSGWIPRGSTRFKRNLGTKNLNVSISCFDRDRWNRAHYLRAGWRGQRSRLIWTNFPICWRQYCGQEYQGQRGTVLWKRYTVWCKRRCLAFVTWQLTPISDTDSSVVGMPCFIRILLSYCCVKTCIK